MQLDEQQKLKWCPDCQEEIEVSDGQNTCPHCGGVLEEVPGEEDLLKEEGDQETGENLEGEEPDFDQTIYDENQ